MDRYTCASLRQFIITSFLISALPGLLSADWLKSQLSGTQPDEEVLYLDIDEDGEPDIIETWWNGHRVRWLDENGDLQPGDVRGDQVMDVLQIDMDHDGTYDGRSDINVKWADLDRNGIPDMQAVVHNPGERKMEEEFWHRGQWMIFRNFDDRGVLGWMDWTHFHFDCWGYTGTCNWLPNYHGDSLFLKVHTSVTRLEDPTLNWENPFIFYDPDDDGVCEYAMRWLDSRQRVPGGLSFDGFMDDAYLTFDIDNDSGKDNESDFDFTIRSRGRPGIDYREMVQDVQAFVGNPKFDVCFSDNVWRRLDSLRYIPPETTLDLFFAHDWEETIFVFDEDDDDHRWERVELYHDSGYRGRVEADPYSTERWEWESESGKTGVSGHPQADSLGDRGEFDRDNSGRGHLYIGVFDQKFHLAGAEWGVWTIDAEGAFHGGRLAPSPKPQATQVYELIKYTDTDGNGFIDLIEYDYDGSRAFDFRVSLLDFASADDPHPDVADTIDIQSLGYEGLQAAYRVLAEQSWIDALKVYRAAWKRGLTTPEIDKLANASSLAQRHAEAFWIKELLFREIRQHLHELKNKQPDETARLAKLESDLIRFNYTGKVDAYVDRIAEIPTVH